LYALLLLCAGLLGHWADASAAHSQPVAQAAPHPDDD